MVQDRTFIRDYLAKFYDEIEPLDFYREIFPEGELEEAGQHEEGFTGKYNALAVELLPPPEKKQEKRADVRKYIITDDLDVMGDLLQSRNFIIISPISYIGKSRKSQNARYIYALAIDLDGVAEQHHLVDLLHQIEIGHLPKPTYLVWSGTGLHLYYHFVRSIPCFPNIVKQLAALKRELTRRIWNGFVTELAEKPQIESLFQGFRMVGGVTKGGNRTKAFAFGEKVEVEYLNDFVPENARLTRYAYKSNLTLKEAEKKYPEWYNRRIVEKQKRGTWTANRAVYDWWVNRLTNEIVVGHRYYGVMVLAVYAKKCGIPQEELEEDAFGLVSRLDSLTTDDSNHFTREDVLAALEMFNDNYITFPIDSITKLTAIPIEKNKRNHRKQSVHLKIARSTKEILRETGDLKRDGRPSKKEGVQMWRMMHPDGTAKECAKDLQIGLSTVYRHWTDAVSS